MELTAQSLHEFAPKARPDYLKVIGEEGNDVLSRFNINANHQRFCHFMAQVGHECGGFTIVEESGAYSAPGIMRIFGVGNHSAAVTESEASRIAALPVAQRGEALFERVYGLPSPRKARDLGNTQPGDGYKYRGRGFLQITGRAAYREMGKRIGTDLEANPDLAGQPLGALMTAAAFWDSRKLNTYADQDNIEIITKRINGGQNGLADRKARYKAAVGIWGEDDAKSRGVTRGGGGARPPLEYGDLGPDVLAVKRALDVLGYGGFALDEDFGKATHLAVASFQIDRGLPGNGIVDADTWEVLERDAKAAGYVPAAAAQTPGRAGPARGDPEAASEPASFNWGRGRAVWIWGILLLFVALWLGGLKVLENPNVLKSKSPRDLIDLGVAALTAFGSIMLIALGSRDARSSNRRVAVRAIEKRAILDEGLRRAPDVV